MFCTQCGTQVDESKKFCRNCGASLSKAHEPASTMVLPKAEGSTLTGSSTSITNTISTDASVAETQPVLMIPKERRGLSASIVIAAAVLVVFLVGGAGVYFGTNLFREPAPPEISPAPGPMVTNPEPAPPASAEGDRIPEGPSERDLNAALQSPPLEPLAPAPVEAPKPKEPAPRADVAKRSRPLSSEASGSNQPVQERVARAPTPPIPPRRAAFSPGTYETLRSTNVLEGPSPSARIVAGIESGVRINVVAANGDWLEVRSRHGNPPGFIRKEDARLVERAE